MFVKDIGFGNIEVLAARCAALLIASSSYRDARPADGTDEEIIYYPRLNRSTN